jgi:hypothetical protein
LSRDGKAIFLSSSGNSRFARTDGKTEPAGGDAFLASFSPDGDWLAYTSAQTGQNEIWIRSYPDAQRAQQISVEGGTEAVWCACGELFYRNGNQWFSTKISTRAELYWEPPKRVFQTEFIDTPGTSYAVSPDGQRLLVVKSADPAVPTQLHIITNWFDRF